MPVLVGLTVLGQLVGTALAGRTARSTAGVVATIVGVAAVLLVAGVLVGAWVGFALIGAGYGLVHNAIIVSEARLQDAIEGRARATVTSVYGVLSEVVALTGYGLFAVGTAWWSVSTTLVALVVPAGLVALLVPRWLPHRRPSGVLPGS